MPDKAFPRTKIVATLGPASSSAAILRQLIREGVDVFRLNFSHGSHAQFAEVAPLIRRLADKEGRAVALLQDIQGPRLRTGRLAEGRPVELKTGQKLSVASEDSAGSPDGITISHPRLAEDLAPGHRILIADGTIALRVVSVSVSAIQATVEKGGTLGERKGVNLPDSRISAPSLTEKDRADLAFGMAQGMDYVALSFVRRREDVLACRRLIHQLGSSAPVIAKIEHPEAVENLEGVLAASDGVMVARGDLGVEVSPERVPMLQKRIIRRANELNLPVITATQMLESMVEQAIPTRAEASDVANAILDGTDALMLSAETATGRYPVEAVQTMVRIALETEGASLPAMPRSAASSAAADQLHSIARAARNLAEDLGTPAMAVFTKSGRSGQLLSKERPSAPVYAFTPDPVVYRRLALWHGLTPILTELADDATIMVDQALRELVRLGLVTAHESVVVVGSTPRLEEGRTNLITVQSAGGE
jgi:pyruvate kinase